MVSRIAVGAFLLCGYIAGSAENGRAQELSEQEALSRFAEENPMLQALEAQVRIARAEAAGTSLPSNPSVTYNREDAGATLDNFVLLQQRLPLNGRLRLLRRAGAAATEAAEAHSTYARWSLRCDLRIAFYSLLLAQEREASWDQVVADFQEVVRILREQEATGESSKFDRLRAERELAGVQAEGAAAQAQRAQAQARLAAFLGDGTSASSLRAIGEFALAGTLPPVDELVLRALARRGDHLSEVKQGERYEYERRAAERRRIPDPVITAGLKRSRLQGLTDNGYALAVTIPLPLFNHGQADAARARASAERSAAISRSLEQGIRAEVQGAHAALEIRMRTAREYARDLALAGNELGRIAQIAYQEGEQDILELLDAYRVALSSRVRALEFQAEAKIADIELERSVGGEVMP